MLTEFDPALTSTIDNLVQSAVNEIIQCPTIDSTYYEKHIKEHLLYLPKNLARQAVAISVLVFELNLQYETLVKNVSGKGVLDRGPYPKAFVIATYLNAHKKAHQIISELGDDTLVYLTNFVNALLLERPIPNFQPILEKLKQIKPAMDSAHLEFVKTIFPQRNA